MVFLKQIINKFIDEKGIIAGILLIVAGVLAFVLWDSMSKRIEVLESEKSLLITKVTACSSVTVSSDLYKQLYNECKQELERCRTK